LLTGCCGRPFHQLPAVSITLEALRMVPQILVEHTGCQLSISGRPAQETLDQFLCTSRTLFLQEAAKALLDG
jgi:hypothetical protein